LISWPNPDAVVIDQLDLDRLRSAEPVAATGKLTRFRIGAGENVPGEGLSEVPIEFPRLAYRRLGVRTACALEAAEEQTFSYFAFGP
jgi:hypothetical protein